MSATPVLCVSFLPGLVTSLLDYPEVFSHYFAHKTHHQVIFNRRRFAVVDSRCRVDLLVWFPDLYSDRRESKRGLAPRHPSFVTLIVDDAMLVRLAAGFGAALISVCIYWAIRASEKTCEEEERDRKRQDDG